jgi:hypothetical protein
MLPWIVIGISLALATVVFWRCVEHSPLGLLIPMGLCLFGWSAAMELDGVHASRLQDRALDFDTVPVCFRTTTGVEARHPKSGDAIPAGLFCCRQAGDLSCVIDWSAPRLGIDEED